MSDKPLVQQALAQTLADLTLVVRPKSTKPEKNGRVERVKSTLAFLKGFWSTVCREWVGLDRLRFVCSDLPRSCSIDDHMADASELP